MSILKVIVLPLVLFCAYGGFEYYESHAKAVELKERVHGMSEYEVCQVAYEEFGIDSAKEIGCRHNSVVITD
jgi:hypothetical protein